MDTSPSPVPEAELLAAIRTVSMALSKQFSFASYTPEDIKQQVALFALEGLKFFDPKRGRFDAFLFVRARRLLTNMKRDVLRRADPVYRQCYEGVPHERGPACAKQAAWARRQDRKAALAKGAPADASFVDGPHGSTDVGDDAATAELLRLLDERLDIDHRRTLLQLRAGLSVGKAKREAVMKAVREILGDGLETSL